MAWRGCHACLVRMPRVLAELPTLGRYTVLGALFAGVLGCLAGLTIGLVVYAPTAWAATLELGVPAAVLGAILGLAVGAVVIASSGGGSPKRAESPTSDTTAGPAARTRAVRAAGPPGAATPPSRSG